MLKKFYPTYYFEKVEEISIEFIKNNNIRGFIFDLDNTLIDGYLNATDGVKAWVETIKANGVKGFILSNTHKKQKAEKFANLFGFEYRHLSAKPSKKGFADAIERLGLKKEEICVVGDQIFTDVIGAKRMGLRSILVSPVGEKEELIIKAKRLLEKPVLNSYMKTKEEN